MLMNHIPKNKFDTPFIYLSGNSLGLQPHSTQKYVQEELDAWKYLGVDGHLTSKRPWLPYHEFLTSYSAEIVGALDKEVVVMNSLTVNLHLLMISFYRPNGKRKKILIEKNKNEYLKNPKPLATRKSSEMFLELITSLPNLIGGSADLAGSNNTKTKKHEVIKPGNFKGNYIHYGVREHGMAGIMNGMALHGGIIPYGGTFLIFSDYCKPSLRLSALMGLKVIYVFSHDSIGLGEDGPTHQPVEHLAHLRAIPNLNVFRPADTIETLECWETALKSSTNPSVIALSRQKIQFVTETLTNKNMSALGGYELKKTNSNPEITLIASGSEVEIAIDALNKLKETNISSKVVSMPCQELFDKQPKEYREKVIEKNSKKISIEASSIFGWEKYVDSDGVSLGLKSFGKSAPYKAIYENFKLTSDSVVMIAKKMLGK